MPLSYRNIIILTCLVISFLVTLIITRVTQFTPKSQKTAVSAYEPPILRPDPEFFNVGTLVDSIKTSITGTKKPSESNNPSANNEMDSRITARAYLVGNVNTGKILIERNARMVLPVASMSKLVTAFVATDELSLKDKIEITEAMTDVPPDASNLKKGEVFTVQELLHPMLLNSSNVAAEALASSSNRMHFMDQMKSYAWEIGMFSSYFDDPTGLSSANNASAQDLFSLAQYLYKYRPDILTLTRIRSMEVASTTEHGEHEITNIHPFVYDDRFIGGKTGRTPQAGDTMMTILNINNQPLAFIVLGSRYDGRASDTRLLLEKISSY